MVIFNSDMRRLVRQRVVLNADEGVGRAPDVTPREQDVLSLFLQGLPSKIIAEQLGISIRTVEFHRANILQKFNAKNATELAYMILTKA